ncbi:hypothetical protein BDR04DRAFT_1091237 [Suillus decipiens]|nr:hypothetical protein BDR04DRAFT_1091237 [Suillus decipiens]
MSEHPVTALTGFKLQAQDPGRKDDEENGQRKDTAVESGTGVPEPVRTFDPPQDIPTTMSPTVADLSEDALSSKGPPVPIGWTAEFTDDKNAETMLNYSTGLTASLELTEVAGSRYIFSSGKSYYIWNTASQQGSRILNAKDRDELYINVAKGKGGLEMEELPDFGSDLEG